MTCQKDIAGKKELMAWQAGSAVIKRGGIHHSRFTFRFSLLLSFKLISGVIQYYAPTIQSPFKSPSYECMRLGGDIEIPAITNC